MKPIDLPSTQSRSSRVARLSLALQSVTNNRPWLHHLPINQKIGLSNSVALGVVALGMAFGILVSNQLRDQTKLQLELAVEDGYLLRQFQVEFLHAEKHRAEVVDLLKTSKQLREFYAEYAEYQAEIADAYKLWQRLKAIHEVPDAQELHKDLAAFQNFFQKYDGWMRAYTQQLETMGQKGIRSRGQSIDLATPHPAWEFIQRSSVTQKIHNLETDLEHLAEIKVEEFEALKADLSKARGLETQILSGSLLLSVIVAALLNAYLSRMIAQPLQIATQVAQQVSQTHDFSLRVPVINADEVGVLVVTLNQLIERVQHLLSDRKASEAALQQLNQELEDRVQERTAQLQASLQEKEVLLKEIHHRVKNNLQIISSLLRMQARRAKDGQAVTQLRDSQGRVQSMALIHEQLYQSVNLSHIDFGDYLQTLVSNLFQTYGVNQKRIAFSINAHCVSLNLNTAISCGLIVNELVTNALKYAFPNERSGKITIQLDIEPTSEPSSPLQGLLVVADDGVGLLTTWDWQTSNSLGLRIVHNLVTQLQGSVTLERNFGTMFAIAFPVFPS